MRKTFLLAPILAAGLFFGPNSSALADSTLKLAGNHPVEAETTPPTANAAPGQVLTMEVRFAVRNRAELDKLLAEQQDPTSPNYHKWLASGEFDRRFGATPAQVSAVSDWLRSQGFTVVSASPQAVEFRGTVSQSEHAFSVRIAIFGNGKFFGNSSDPYIPAEFDGVIARIEGLDNMREAVPASRQHLMHRAPAARPSPAPRGGVAPQSRWSPSRTTESPSAIQPDAKIGGATAFGPKDVQTFYNE